MPKDEEENEVENVFNLSILTPLTQYLRAFFDVRHNLSPDEFLKAIYVPEKCSPKTSRKHATCAVETPKTIPKDLQVPPVLLQKPIAGLFFEIVRLQPFICKVVQEFCKRRNRRGQIDPPQAIALAYVLIYRTSVVCISDVLDCLMLFDVSKMLALLSFLLTPKLGSWFYITGCDVFDVEFVEQKILEPFTTAVPVLQTIYTSLLASKRPKVSPKKVTIPVKMNVLRRIKRLPAAPACTPEMVFKAPVQPVPKTLYKPPEIESKIANLRNEHRVQAARRLEHANAKVPACFKTEKSKRYQRLLNEVAEERIKCRRSIVAKRIPVFKNVPIKNTVTTILREGARISSREVKEVEKLKELMKGSFNPSEVQRMEEDVRRWEKEESLRKIEEKHLAGLISYEESLLAKQQLADEAKAQGDKVRSEREKLNAKLEKYRTEEMAKLRRTVERCHEAEQMAKNAYTSMVDEKRQKAAEVAEESRRIKVCLIEQKEEELRRKLQVIQEIKTLQSLQGQRAKELDQAETGRLGLMCEMSLAELKERLYLAKDKWRDELISRRDAVKERRRKQKDLVDCVQKMINEHRGSKQTVSRPAPVVYDNSKILQTPELEALRRKLDDRRINRIHRMNTPSTNVIFKSKLLTNSSECFTPMKNRI